MFTDDLHKLVDDWAKEKVGNSLIKPSLNQIKQNKHRLDSDSWSKVYEVLSGRVFVSPEFAWRVWIFAVGDKGTHKLASIDCRERYKERWPLNGSWKVQS